MVPKNLERSRSKQGIHGYLGGAAGNCEKAKSAGARLGGKNDSPRQDPGCRVS